MSAGETGDFALGASAVGAIGYAVTMLLPDDATGFWGVVCDVLTLWGWGGWTSLVLLGLFAVLALTRWRSKGFTRTPRWLTAPLAAAVAVVTLPVLLVLLLVFAAFDSASDRPPEMWDV